MKKEVCKRSAEAAARLSAYRSEVDGVEEVRRAGRCEEGHVGDKFSSAKVVEGGPSTGTSENYESTYTELPFPSSIAPISSLDESSASKPGFKSSSSGTSLSPSRKLNLKTQSLASIPEREADGMEGKPIEDEDEWPSFTVATAIIEPQPSSSTIQSSAAVDTLDATAVDDRDVVRCGTTTELEDEPNNVNRVSSLQENSKCNGLTNHSNSGALMERKINEQAIEMTNITHLHSSTAQNSLPLAPPADGSSGTEGLYMEVSGDFLRHISE